MSRSQTAIAPQSRWKQPWMLFLVLAVGTFIVPSAFGHPLASGDNLIQFNPLRKLAGDIASQGYLPLWNKFDWSGTPLMAGFNAGFYLPSSWLYIVLPSQIAWGITQAIPYFLAGLGFYRLMREYEITKFSATVGGLVFAYSGVMVGQGVHLDMITGISLAPWMLLCTKRIIEDNSYNKLAYSLSLAFLYCMVVLAGAPEAMLDELIMLIVFAIVELIRFRDQFLRKVLFLCLAGLIALGLSAAQWIPGLAFQRISQRSAPTLSFVSFGSYAPQYFFSLVAPFLFGGPGAFNVPGYFGPFNWEEVIIYSTIGPVIALFSTVARLIKRTLQSELIPYFAMAVVSVLLALGGHTPLESLLYHLPLYGKQRLSGRNILVFDTSIIVFFTFWLDRILKGSQKSRLKLALLTFSPSVLITVLYLAFIAKPVQVERFFKASANPLYLTKSLELEIYLIQLVVALVAGFCYYKAASGTLTTRRSKQFIVATVLIDLLAFNIFGTFGTPSYLDIFRSTSPQMELVHSAIGSNYRFALYNPNLYSYSQTMAYGQPNLNIAADNMSIQGYSSLSLKNYQEATGSHAQATLNPKLLASPLVNQLATKLILTNWRYLIEPYGSPTLVPIPQVLTPTVNNSKPHSKTRSISTSGYFGRLLNVKGLDLHLGSQFQPSSIVKVGLLQKGGSIVWLSRSNSKSQPTGALHFSPSESKSKPVKAIGVVIHQNLSSALSDPSNALAVGVGISSTNGYFAMHGSLTSYLTYPHFIFNGITHDVSSFTNAMAQPILKPASQSVKILQHSTLLNGTLKLQVAATKTSYINWAETTAPGWKVSYQAPNSSKIRTLPVSTKGITQKIPVPRGTWYITVYYHPSSAYEGIAISLVSLAAFLILLTYPKISRKKSSLKL